jgi:hypothetical protein
MTRKFAALAAFALALSAPLAHAQSTGVALADVPINDKTPIFCRDNTGTPVLQTYSNLGGVMRRWKDRFHFDMSVQPGSPLKLVFSDPAESPYSFTYAVQPYRDDIGHTGILLLSMHVFLDNADRDLEGAPLCYFTEFGK